MANIIVSIDDTDGPGTPGTGELLENIIEKIGRQGLGTPTFITRHQLLVHPDIPYTSHNSAMCVELLDAGPEDEVYAMVVEEVTAGMAEGSDPGICIVQRELLAGDHADRITGFGKRAQREVLTKDMAYSLAEETGVRLSEHGGTGDGIIGAFAGIGLRLTGNDGRVKGRFRLQTENDLTTIANFFECGRVDTISTPENKGYEDSDIVSISGDIKTIFLGGKRVLPVVYADNGIAKWRTLTKGEIKERF